MTILNVFLICLSLKYLNNNYENISDVSKWIFNEMIKVQYNDSKLFKSLNKLDFETSKILLKFVKNIQIIDDYLLEIFREEFIHCYNIVKFLLYNQIHINSDWMLIHACEQNQLDVIKLLLDNGANIHIKHEYPLYSACRDGYTEIVKLLLDKGAKITNKRRYTVLENAIIHDHYHLVKILIGNGAIIKSYDIIRIAHDNCDDQNIIDLLEANYIMNLIK